MTHRRILIIEDEVALASALATVCERLGATAQLCASGERGLEEFSGDTFALVILDIGLPDMSGLQVLENVLGKSPRQPVLVITAHGTLDNAVGARQLGAAAYLVKPLDLRELEQTIREFLFPDHNENSAEKPKSSKAAQPEESSALLGGAAPEMQKTFISIAHATTTDAPALITGPTGTGKTLAARVIHANSRRRNGPFVTLLCGAMPEQLLESELFGHEKSAFTGASTMRAGHIERAAGGTLFLDEIADVPLPLQPKLLRFVEERKFTRIGGRQDIHIDLRLIAATNRSLRDEVQAGRFREDLYYRLHVLEVALPPLAKRREDIPGLTAFFLGQIAAGREVTLNAEASRMIATYAWPGNVRELRNAIEHAVTVCPGKVIQPRHLPDAISRGIEAPAEVDLDSVMRRWVENKVQTGATYKTLYGEVESMLLKHLLGHFEQKPTILARVLKMNRATLLKKRRQLGLDG